MEKVYVELAWYSFKEIIIQQPQNSLRSQKYEKESYLNTSVWGLKKTNSLHNPLGNNKEEYHEDEIRSMQLIGRKAGDTQTQGLITEKDMIDKQ